MIILPFVCWRWRCFTTKTWVQYNVRHFIEPKHQLLLCNKTIFFWNMIFFRDKLYLQLFKRVQLLNKCNMQNCGCSYTLITLLKLKYFWSHSLKTKSKLIPNIYQRLLNIFTPFNEWKVLASCLTSGQNVSAAGVSSLRERCVLCNATEWDIQPTSTFTYAWLLQFTLVVFPDDGEKDPAQQ